jgi:tRNA (cytidine/uridine-2'-O-)-methyltransferase
MRLALFQPDIPQNVGAAIRLAGCLGVPLDVIEPCGFPLSDQAIRRSALDYGTVSTLQRHDSWTRFLQHPARAEGRLVLFTTKSAEPFTTFRFARGDTLLFGRESAGAPDEVHDAAAARLFIPIRGRSLNLVSSASMALGEALRQTGGFPSLGD